MTMSFTMDLIGQGIPPTQWILCSIVTHERHLCSGYCALFLVMKRFGKILSRWLSDAIGGCEGPSVGRSVTWNSERRTLQLHRPAYCLCPPAVLPLPTRQWLLIGRVSGLVQYAQKHTIEGTKCSLYCSFVSSSIVGRRPVTNIARVFTFVISKPNEFVDTAKVSHYFVFKTPFWHP